MHVDTLLDLFCQQFQTFRICSVFSMEFFAFFPFFFYPIQTQDYFILSYLKRMLIVTILNIPIEMINKHPIYRNKNWMEYQSIENDSTHGKLY